MGGFEPDLAAYSQANDGVTPVACTVMRGGTSRAVFVRERALPDEKPLRDRLLLSVMGSPHPRQIDGIGGADILTSKVAVVGPSDAADADVDYEFGQVSIEEPRIDWDVSCGNISAAVGPFAITEGLVAASEPSTTVTIRDVNSGLRLTNEVPVANGVPRVEGDFAIRGVPGTGARINVGFRDPGGGSAGAGVLPTGSAREERTVDGDRLTCSVVDAGNPCVFVEAADLGCDGTELPDEIDGNDALVERIERLRTAVAVDVGLAPDRRTAREERTVLPLVVLVAEPTDYVDFEGNSVESSEVSLVARLVAERSLHKAYAGTGAVCTGVASRIPGTVVDAVADSPTVDGDGRERLTIGHPSGTMDALVETDGDEVEQVLFGRTARRLVSGVAFPRPDLPAGSS